MTQDSLARDLSATPADDAPSEDALYEALVAALRSNARGRAFLDEYARRCRAEDLAAALAALARIETLLTHQRAAEATETTIHEIHPDDAFVPFEFDLLPDTTAPVEPHDVIEPELPRRSSADLLAQVMALSPDERIALFS
jgi:hypothetical protein